MLKIIDFDATPPDDEKPAKAAAVVTVRLISSEGQAVPGASVHTTIWKKSDGTGEVRGKLRFGIPGKTTIVGYSVVLGGYRVVEAFNTNYIYGAPGTLTLDGMDLTADAMLRLGIG